MKLVIVNMYKHLIFCQKKRLMKEENVLHIVYIQKNKI